MGRWKHSPAADKNTQDEVSTSRSGLRVAIVGSGPAGIFCADRLAELSQAGQAELSGPVQLFRSRSKLSASQMEGEHNTIYPSWGAPFFDYGCQYITAGNPWFQRKMHSYEKAGLCHRWPAGVLSSEHGYEPLDPIPGWAGSRGMWAFQEGMVQHVANERRDFLKLHHAVQRWPPGPGDKWLNSTAGPNANPLVVTSYHKNGDGTWTLSNRLGEVFGPFDVLIGAYYSHAHTDQQLASSATQRIRNYLHKNLRFAPLIVVWVAFEHPLKLDFNAAFVADEPLSWVSNNNAKVGEGVPFTARGRELWTLMATTKYSIESVARDARGHRRRAFVDLLAAFGKLVGKDLWSYQPKLVRANHWGGAMPCTTLPSDAGCIFDSAQSIGWCGAWATYSGVEGAAVSGKQMAELVAGLSLGKHTPTEAEFPEGAWLDIGCRASDDRICLSHGFFHVKQPRLQSIMLLPRLLPEPEGLHHQLEGWDFTDSDTKASFNRSPNQKVNAASDSRGEKQEADNCFDDSRASKKKHAKRRWVPVQRMSGISEAAQGG
mmetsp:Transcript_59184/g.108853  ORF Transcript_59184/g.108853 Transcript_59184/m.108853 type:complete len:544 (+) Transcript_59184:54-1685(+)